MDHNQKEQIQENKQQQSQQTSEVTTATKIKAKDQTSEGTLNAEQVSAMLKEKIKQNKLLQAKNSKLQIKYVQLFRQQKLLKQDNKVFIQFIQGAFQSLKDKIPGSYQLQELKNALNEREVKLNEKIREIVESCEKQKADLSTKAREGLEQKMKYMEAQNKNSSESTLKQLESYKRNNKVLSDQIGDLDRKLTGKNEQVSKLTKQSLKLQHQINQYKIRQIKAQIGESQKAKEEKVNGERNQILRLTHQIDDLMQKRDELKNDLKKERIERQRIANDLQSTEKMVKELKQKIDQQNKQKQKRSGEERQNSRVEQPPKLLQIKNSSSFEENNKKQFKFEDEEDMFQGDSDYVHRQYMKNVFLRYMKCVKGGDLIHAQILLNIIVTILKFDAKEKELANEKKKGWWGIY